MVTHPDVVSNTSTYTVTHILITVHIHDTRAKFLLLKRLLGVQQPFAVAKLCSLLSNCQQSTRILLQLQHTSSVAHRPAFTTADKQRLYLSQRACIHGNKCIKRDLVRANALYGHLPHVFPRTGHLTFVTTRQQDRVVAVHIMRVTGSIHLLKHFVSSRVIAKGSASGMQQRIERHVRWCQRELFHFREQVQSFFHLIASTTR
jgi:hypothetical protein